MAPSSIIAFWAVAVLLIVTPGADWAFTLSAVLRGNGVVAAVGGLVTGYTAVTAVVAAGVGALVAGSAVALTVITLTGSAYLVWLGVATLRHPPSPVTDPARADRTDRATYLEGIGVSGLNPKGLLILVAILPQFTDPEAPWPMAAQMAALGLTFTLTCAGFYALVGTVARALLLARPRAARVAGVVSGVGLVAVGALLTADRLLR
jgi:threonine/homoserine/homoserine lactone efflux protein